MVAKSFQGMLVQKGPYVKNGKEYVTVLNTSNGKTREVRWYSEAEYRKMYPEEPPKRIRSVKDVMGFEEGYITLVKGDAYPLIDWLKENGAYYNTFFGWHFKSKVAVPVFFPEGITPVVLKWEEVRDPVTEELIPKAALAQVVERYLYDPSPSEYQGEVGDRIERVLTVTKVVERDGYYGTTKMFLFIDDNENVYMWNTATKNYEVGQTVKLRGSIKDLSMYHNTKQTVLTRCREI